MCLHRFILEYAAKNETPRVYNLLRNNCEHLSNQFAQGGKISHQVYSKSEQRTSGCLWIKRMQSPRLSWSCVCTGSYFIQYIQKPNCLSTFPCSSLLSLSSNVSCDPPMSWSPIKEINSEISAVSATMVKACSISASRTSLVLLSTMTSSLWLIYFQYPL
jgi:hypothetical protein